MTNKNSTIIFSLLMFSAIMLVSCSDDSATGPLNITGQWGSNEYLYYPNCEGDGTSFEDYINGLIESAQGDQAQNYVDYQCSEEQLGTEFCNGTPFDATIYETNADSMFAYYLNTLIIPEWNNNPSYSEIIEQENTYIAEIMDIGLNINADNTYTISWDGTCVDYPEFSEDQCNALSAAEWNGASCNILTQDGCESIFVNGTWDDGSSGVLDEDGDNYTMNDVDDDSSYDGMELIFDGNKIFITVISQDDLCVRLGFSK